MSVEQVLHRFGKYIVKQSRSNLTRKGKRNTSDLYDSLSYYVKTFKNSFEFGISMEDYGTFVDKGVKGFQSSSKAPKSPYKFGTGTGKKGGLTQGIDRWVRSKRLQFRKADGRFMSYANTSFLIRRSVWNTGIETTFFFSRPFELAFKKLPEEVVEAYGLELDKFLELSLR